MRIPKAYLINGILLALAIVSWAAFLRQNSPARHRAESEAFAASFLNRQLPQQAADVQLLLDTPSGEPIHAFPPLTGKVIGSSELRQIETRVQFYAALAFARKTADNRAWKRLGEARIISSGSSSVVAIEVYETPDRHLGFQRAGSYYQADDEVSQKLLDFIHDTQNTKAA